MEDQPTSGRPGIDFPHEYVEKADGSKLRKKATKVQKALRVQQLVTWMLEGANYTEVVKRGRKKWGLTTRPVEKMIAEAREQVEASAAQEVKSAATLALYRLTELYFAALEDKDYKTALDVVKTQNKMLGLNAPDKLEAKTVQDWNSMDVAEQLEHIGGILEQRDQEQKELN